jgi:NADH-quinone oxidoreductase subunit K
MPFGVNHFIVITAILFGLGLYSVITYKNRVKLLSGIVLIFLSAILNFAAFSNFNGFNTEGQIIVFILSAACLLLFSIGFIILKQKEAASEGVRND